MLDILAQIMEPDHPGFGIDDRDRHLQHLPRSGRDRQDRRIGLPAFFAQGRQHDRHDRVVMAQHVLQRLVEPARIIALGSRDEFVIEPELVKEFAQFGVVVMGEAFVPVERIGNAAERVADMRRQQSLVGHVVGHLAQPVHVIRKRHQPRRPGRSGFIGAQHFIRPADQCGAQHFLERADVRQARRAIPGFEQHRRVLLAVRIPLEQLACFIERPRLGNLRGGENFGAIECGFGHPRPFADAALRRKREWRARCPGPCSQPASDC